jgi:4-cresol dehydrogenase (hydroxylating)
LTEVLDQALDAFREAVGPEYVIADEPTRQAYETATFETRQRIPAIVRPGNVDELAECLRIANRFRIPVYPISTGLNIGYGSAVPTQDGSVILEMKRMNRILEFSEDLAYVTVEPGVTQRQLYSFLREQNSGLWMDATGGPADHSLIGNIAERGFGHTPYADHFANVGGMEVMLPSGERFHTGFGRYPNAKAKGVYRWGVGPYLDGLFTQSNLGIITQATIWLMPAPEYFQMFFFSVAQYEQLAGLIDLLRPLRLDGTIDSAMHIGNDHKVLSSIRRYPWEMTEGQTPLPQDVLAHFANSWDFGAWNASGALYGTRAEVAAARRRIKKQLRGRVEKLRFLDTRGLWIADRLKKTYHRLTGVNLPEMLKILKPVFGMTSGVPTDEMLPSTYWRKPGAVPVSPDPNRDRCGLIWLAPVAPTRGESVMKIWNITRDLITGFGFEPAVSITLITPRALDCVISISYDRDVIGEDERALQCQKELLLKLADAGFYPYRLGVQSMGILPAPTASYMDLIKETKMLFDPNQILAPGRYE